MNNILCCRSFHTTMNPVNCTWPRTYNMSCPTSMSMDPCRYRLLGCTQNLMPVHITVLPIVGETVLHSSLASMHAHRCLACLRTGVCMSRTLSLGTFCDDQDVRFSGSATLGGILDNKAITCSIQSDIHPNPFLHFQGGVHEYLP